MSEAGPVQVGGEGTTRFPPCALWDFAVALYGKPGCAPACLSLQARRGADVNLLLFALWAGASGRGRLAPEALARAAESVAPWHGKIVRSLRAARDALKCQTFPAEPTLAQNLRRRILALELEAEHIEALILASLAPPPAEPPAPAERRARDGLFNMRAYLATLGPGRDAQDWADILALLAGAFPELDAAALGAPIES
ncbi:MAG TPA: TIGR02444 family protein [Alphaproteobacteria bacterium]|nr:TIGR02444 family protein [Alphaproteobacteria bacterium]